MDSPGRQGQVAPFEDGLRQIKFVNVGPEGPNITFEIGHLAQLDHLPFPKFQRKLNRAQASVARQFAGSDERNHAIQGVAEFVEFHVALGLHDGQFGKGKRSKELLIHRNLKFMFAWLQPFKSYPERSANIHDLQILGTAKIDNQAQKNNYLRRSFSRRLFDVISKGLEAYSRWLRRWARMSRAMKIADRIESPDAFA